MKDPAEEGGGPAGVVEGWGVKDFFANPFGDLAKVPTGR